MAIEKKWLEVEDECFGPDKTASGWVMYLLIRPCTEYSRKTKRGVEKFVRRGRTVISLIGMRKKDVLRQLEKYMGQENVFLLE